MKAKFLIGIGILAFTVSCSEDWGNVEGDGAGYIVPRVDVDTKTISSSGIASRSELSELSKEDLTLYLTKSDGSVSWQGKCSEFPTDKAFSIGSYTLEAKYGDPKDEGFEKPALYGVQTLIVADGKTTEISLTASPCNSQVTLEYTEAFINYMNDWSATVNGIEYAKAETRPVYVNPGDVAIRINITKPNGVGGQLSLDRVTAEPKYSYKVTIDVNQGNVGDASLVVTYDDNFDQETIEIDLSDEVLLSPLPEISNDGFENSVPIKVISGLSEITPISVSMIAQAGVKEVNLKTSSTSLKSQGWPEFINLLEADLNQQNILTNLGLDALGVWKTPGAMAYLDFSNVAEHINYLVNGDNTTSFEISVKDKLMRETEPIRLVFEVEAVNLELASAGDYYNPGNPLSVKLSFNGDLDHIKNGKVKFQFYDETGLWRDIKINEVKEGASQAEFIVSVIIPEYHNDNLKLRTICGETTSNEFLVEVAPFEVVTNENYVFATHAFVRAKSTNPEFSIGATEGKYQLRKNGEETYTDAETSIENGYVKILKLSPNTTYQVKVLYDGMDSKPVTIKTEPALEVPNGNFDDTFLAFSETDFDQGAEYTIAFTFQNIADFDYYESAGWTSDNVMTMGGKVKNTWFCQPSVFTTNSKYTGYGSGRLDKKESEEFNYSSYTENGIALAVRNIGWHENGTLPAKKSGSGYNNSNPTTINKHIGKAILGTYKDNFRDEISEGKEFIARPTSLKGHYMYFLNSKNNDEANNNDKGKVVVKIMKDNEVLAEGSSELSATSAYQDFSIDLSYDFNNLKKANKLYISVQSSILDEDQIIITPFNTRQKSYFHGATLVVDDFEFVY